MTLLSKDHCECFNKALIRIEVPVLTPHLRPSITTYIVKPSPDDPEAGLQPVAQFSEREERLHLFWGTNILSSTTQEDRRLLAWDIRRPHTSIELRSRGPSAGQVRLMHMTANVLLTEGLSSSIPQF